MSSVFSSGAFEMDLAANHRATSRDYNDQGSSKARDVDDDDTRSLLSLLTSDVMPGKGTGAMAFPMPPSTLPIPSSAAHALAPFASSSDYSDGAASSDTDASHINSLSSDAEAGPFTPLTPNTPGAAPRTRRSRTSSDGAAVTRGRGPSSSSWTVTTSTSIPGSAPMSSSTSNPWRPRQLQLVHRRERQGPTSPSLSPWAASESSIRSNTSSAPSTSAPSNSMGLGIQLPKSPAIGSNFPVMGPGRPDKAAPSAAVKTAKSRKKLGGKGQGLKKLALATSSSGSTSPLLATDSRSPTPSSHLLGSPWQRDHASEGELLSSRPSSPAFAAGGWTPRSRQASADSANKSPLSVLPRTPTFATSGADSLSWAREQEERAQRGTTIPPPPRAQEDIVEVTAPGCSSVPSLDSERHHRSDSMTSRQSTSPSRRRKKPPTPLILLPNGRQASLASSSGLLSASSSDKSPTPSPTLLPPLPSTAKSTFSASRSTADHLDASGLAPATSLLSPAGTDLTESFRTPTFSPPSAKAAQLDQKTEGGGDIVSTLKPIQATSDALALPCAKRASTPLKTAYFDPEEADASSPSDYGDGEGEDEAEETAVSSSYSTATAPAKALEDNVPLIFRRMMKNFRSSTPPDQREPNGSQAILSQSTSDTLPSLPSLASLLGSSSSTSSLLDSKGQSETADTASTKLTSYDDVREHEMAEMDCEEDESELFVGVNVESRAQEAASSRGESPPVEDEQMPQLGLGIGIADTSQAGSTYSDLHLPAADIFPDSNGQSNSPSPADQSTCRSAFEFDLIGESERAVLASPASDQSLNADVSEPSRYSMPSAVQDEAITVDFKGSQNEQPPELPKQQPRERSSPHAGPSSVLPDSEVTVTQGQLPVASSDRLAAPVTPSVQPYQSPALGEPPHFNTSIFRAPPTPRRKDFDEDLVAPKESGPSMPSSQSIESLQEPLLPASAANVDFYQQQARPGVRRPTSTLHMQPLHLLSSSAASKLSNGGTNALPSSPGDGKPQLWLNTLAPPVSLRPPQAQKMLPVPSPTAAFFPQSTTPSLSPASTPHSSCLASGQTPPMSSQASRSQMYFVAPRSAPLPQGAFSPAISATPNVNQRSVFEDWDDDVVSTKAQNGGLTSRWSSGSESEVEATTAKRSSSKSRKSASKKRSSSAAPSARNSVSSQAGGAAAGSSTAALSNVRPGAAQLPKGKSFLHSLGLRKKSMPNLRDSAVATATTRSNSPATPGLDSPALPRVSTAEGFPFPGMLPGAPNSKTTEMTAVPPRPPSYQSRSSTTTSAHKKQSPSIFSQLSAPLNHKRSTASLKSEAAGSRGGVGHRSALSINEVNEPPATPTMAQGAHSPRLSPKKEKTSSATSGGTGNLHARKRSGTLIAPMDVAGSRSSLKHLSKSATDLPLSLRQASVDMLRSQTAGEACSPSPEEEATPRVAYIGLADHDAKEPNGDVDAVNPGTAPRAGDDEQDSQAFMAIGQGFVDSCFSPDAEAVDPLSTLRASGVQGHSLRKRLPRRLAKARKAARLARGQDVTAHYPSWSKEGQYWLREQNLDSAEGLYVIAASREQDSGVADYRGFSDGSQKADKDDDDSADEYGSGDDYAGAGPSKGGGGGNGGDGGDGGDSRGNGREDDGDGNRRYEVAKESDASTSEDSEDDYGEDQDSDDQPLGHNVGDIGTLQRRLQRQGKQRREHGERSSRTNAAQSQGKLIRGALDGGELANRLTSLSLRRQQSQASRAAPRASAVDDARAERISRARSLANRVRPRLSSETAPPPAPRSRRGSDAAQRGGQSGLTLPPIKTMPMVSAQAAAMQGSLSAGAVSNTAAVHQAAIAVASKAARDGRIPPEAVPAQAQFFAAQALAARSLSSPSPSSESSPPTRTVHRKPPPRAQGTLDAGSSLANGAQRRPSVSSATSDVSRRARPTGLDVRVTAPMSLDSPASDAYEDALSPRNGERDGRNSERSSAVERRVQEHRVYIVTRQRYSHCEVPIHGRARDVVLDVLERETVQALPGRGGWALFDVSPGLGTERPLREYEVVSAVAEARPDAQNDFFLLKQTELSIYASIRAVPNVSPSLAGNVYLQDKRGKWNKRWLELRDHALYHAKSDKGKDEAFLCHLSAFDVYLRRRRTLSR
ncbi:hypothetical protein BDZ90DRAFT_225930 [Jaminaea rosea]|uniref:Uncharacterized protein n=1 Tax=Jaminaea rosea TaxID=1569628 RepID=A0A316UXY1_9BASI|nr:hypothetical protein BDZ90DRAFT_225930 [Jaminaea rosea]PWN29648.1 hypothetical protein BDZ90DRAFT_225930 [Jaminaea rosea]